MTSKEIILANLEHRNPPRPGMNFDGGRLNDLCGGGVGASARFESKRWQEGQFEYHNDEWGNIWFRIMGKSQGGEIHTPALKDWRQLDTLQLPDYDDPARFAGVKAHFAQHPDQFKSGFMPGWVFATSRYLRKMEVYFADLIEYREEIDRLHEMVTSLFVKVIHNYADAGADAIFFCEDLGVQNSLLVGPAMWRDVFKPHYERLTAAAHERGLKVLMHSCGFVWPLLDDLVAAGIDCFQFDQPAVYDQPALAARLAHHRKALYSPVDIQQVLPTGDKALIEAEAAKMVKLFNGFFIAKNYPDLHGIGVDPQWDMWAYEAICRAAGVEPVKAS